MILKYPIPFLDTGENNSYTIHDLWCIRVMFLEYIKEIVELINP